MTNWNKVFLDLLKKRGNVSFLHKKRDSSHSFGMTNNAVNQEPLGYPELLKRYVFLLLFFIGVNGLCWAKPFEFSLSSPLDLGESSQGATLTVTVEDGYFLYHERFGFAVSTGRISPQYPVPHEKQDPFEEKIVKVYDSGSHQFSLQFTDIFKSAGVATLTVSYQGCSKKTCFLPESKQLSLFAGAPATNPPQSSTKPEASIPAIEANIPAIEANIPAIEANSGPVNTPMGKTDFDQNIKEHGLFWALVLAFLGGILVSFTPCVYPMIPITLSIIGGRKENTGVRRGFVLSVSYVAGLSFTYALLGLLTAFFGAQIRSVLYGALFQTTISVVFFILALSMFDVFLLQIPASIQNKFSKIKGTGLSGVFLMGMVAGLMASPCIAAPLAGILAFIASSGNALTGFLLLTAFAWGMGLLLIVLGTFSGSLNALPKAGEWMVRVKEFYGFLLLGASLYFIQPLLGTAILNLLIGLLLGVFAVFLGLFSPLPDQAGFGTKVLKAWSFIAIVVASAFSLTAAVEWGGLSLPRSAEFSGKTSTEVLTWEEDLDVAISKAKAESKPIFVDFRADWCTICLELEKNVFTHPQVNALLGKMVLVRVDATNNSPHLEKLVKQWSVIGLPTLIMLDSEGKERKDLRVVGEIDWESLEKALRKTF